jgi:hypothetical protein
LARLQGKQAAILYPFGHPMPYAYEKFPVNSTLKQKSGRKTADVKQRTWNSGRETADVKQRLGFCRHVFVSFHLTRESRAMIGTPRIRQTPAESSDGSRHPRHLQRHARHLPQHPQRPRRPRTGSARPRRRPATRERDSGKVMAKVLHVTTTTSSRKKRERDWRRRSKRGNVIGGGRRGRDWWEGRMEYWDHVRVIGWRRQERKPGENDVFLDEIMAPSAFQFLFYYAPVCVVAENEK